MKRVLLGLVLTVGLGGGCRPDYPKCEGDPDCKAGEFCVKEMCQQCRDDRDCKAGKACKKGRCEAAPGSCTSAADCAPGQGCKDGRCGPCDADAQCGEGAKCREGACLASAACRTEDDCAAGEECQDGRCVAPPSATSKQGPCTLELVLFDFNESLLTQDATVTLAKNAECLKSAQGAKIRVEGHCDPRGTEEYNLALGDRRARGAIDHLGRLGVDTSRLRPVSKGKLEAVGTDESGWARDRRADFIWE
ncbi:MAG: OmpA family protein [Myxococcota bacterium]